MRRFKIGNVKLENLYILGPMAGVSDLPFRLLCKEQGAALVCTEMVSANGIFYHNPNTARLLRIDEREKPLSLQIFGSDPTVMAEAARRIESIPFDILDINMGCPVPKIVKNGAGCALMKNPRLVYEIVSSVAKAIKKPVTVKIRKGFDETSINAPEIARIAEQAGALAVTVHGRTREQFYDGRADLEVIQRVKEAVGIPVIGNGDVTSAIEARKMLDETGCDAVMIARAARGNPWIFSEALEYEKTGKLPSRPSEEEMNKMMLRHAKMLVEQYGEYQGILKMRKHISWYTKGMSKAGKLREKLAQMHTFAQLENVLTSRK